MRTAAPPLLFPALLALGGCLAPVRAPSLAPRAIEQVPVGTPLTAPREPVVAADPALVASLDRAVEAARVGDAAFIRVRASAERAVAAARGAAVGSEAWTAAQQEVSALDAARGPVREATAAVDALRQDPANAGTGARVAIEAASQRIEAIGAEEGAAVARLSTGLR